MPAYITHVGTYLSPDLHCPHMVIMLLFHIAMATSHCPFSRHCHYIPCQYSHQVPGKPAVSTIQYDGDFCHIDDASYYMADIIIIAYEKILVEGEAILARPGF